jgi:hypothetical protein
MKPGDKEEPGDKGKPGEEQSENAPVLPKQMAEEVAEETVPNIEVSLRYALGDGQQEWESGCGVARLEKEVLVLSPEGSAPISISLREIQDLTSINYRLVLTLKQGSLLTLRDLGYRFDDFLKAVVLRRNEMLLVDLLMEEKSFKEGSRGHFLWHNTETKLEGEGEFRLYETALVILPDHGQPLRLPLGTVSSWKAQEYRLEFLSDQQESLVLSQLGREYDPFQQAVTNRLADLMARAQADLKNLVPSLDALMLRRLSGLLKEGRAASRRAVEAIFPPFWRELEQRLAEVGLAESYAYLTKLALPELVRIGWKRGLLGDLTGQSLFFLIPMLGQTGGPSNAIAWEASAGEEEGKATYFFRIVGRLELSELTPMALQQKAESFLDVLNRGLAAVNFRREPIYLTEDKLTQPQYTRYRYSLEAIPALRTLRMHFIGRVIHTSIEQWQKDTAELLQFNGSASSDDLRWKKA